MTQQTTIDVLRHGDVLGGEYFRGSTDDPLTELGWRQMHSQCAGREWDTIISSPLRRCQSFASAWCFQQNKTLLIEPAWQEIHFGDWEGMRVEEIATLAPEDWQRFYADPFNCPPPNAEHYIDFMARIKQGWENMLVKHTGQHVLVVTHSGVIRALFSLLLDLPAKQSLHIDVPHASLTRFNCFHDESSNFIQLSFHNPH